MNHLPWVLPTAATYAGLTNKMSLHNKFAKPYLLVFNLTCLSSCLSKDEVSVFAPN